ncbi:hypothetical protein JXI42_11320 [bacterium]|nr:hypothetical protein [bacterium]
MSYKTGILFFILLMAGPLLAARPLSIEDAPLADVGVLELETGYDVVLDRDGSRTKVMSLTLQTGLTERFCLGISVPYHLKPEEGTGTAEIGSKFLVHKEKDDKHEISLLFCYALGAGEYTAILTGTREVLKFILHLNVGYASTGIVEIKGDDILGFAVEAPLTSRIEVVTEIMKVGNSVTHLWGLRANLSEYASLDFGVDFGLNDNSIKRRFTYGMTVVF